MAFLKQEARVVERFRIVEVAEAESVTEAARRYRCSRTTVPVVGGDTGDTTYAANLRKQSLYAHRGSFPYMQCHQYHPRELRRRGRSAQRAHVDSP